MGRAKSELQARHDALRQSYGLNAESDLGKGPKYHRRSGLLIIAAGALIGLSHDSHKAIDQQPEVTKGASGVVAVLTALGSAARGTSILSARGKIKDAYPRNFNVNKRYLHLPALRHMAADAITSVSAGAGSAILVAAAKHDEIMGLTTTKSELIGGTIATGGALIYHALSSTFILGAQTGLADEHMKQAAEVCMNMNTSSRGGN